MKKKDNKKEKISNLGKFVRDWEEGMRIESEELIQFALDKNLNPQTQFSKSQIQSLVTMFSLFKKAQKNKKEQKEQKNTLEIDNVPPQEQKEQDQSHGGEDDQHNDIENADQEENQAQEGNERNNHEETQNDSNSNKNNSDSQDNQNNNSSQNINKKSQQTIKNQSNNQSNSNSSIQKIAQKNKKSNKLLEQFKDEYGDTEKQNISLQQNTSRRIGYGGGGARMDDAKNADIATFRAIQEFLLKLASDPSPMGKLEGKEKWDPIKIVKSRFNGDFGNAKFSRPKERNIWFIVDDSGSVSQFAEFIMSMIQGATNVVNVVHGSEAKPCNWIKLPKVNRPKVLRLYDLQRFTIWKQQFKHSFIECLKTFLKECKIQNGDVLVFWGDLMDALEGLVDTPAMFRKLLRKYKCYWLLSHNGNSSYHGNHTGIIEKSKAFKMLYNINNSNLLKKAIQKIK